MNNEALYLELTGVLAHSKHHTLTWLYHSHFTEKGARAPQKTRKEGCTFPVSAGQSPSPVRGVRKRA